MSTKKPKPTKNRIFSRPLVLAALMAGGILQPYLPALAGGTAPGTISNTATADYKNDNGDVFNATSNTVEVTVAEVSALSVVPAGITDLDAGTVQAGDLLNFDFKVTNDGNAPTDIVVPALANIAVENFNPSALEYAVVAPNGTIGVFSPLPPAGGVLPIPGGLAPESSVIVRVKGAVPATGLTAGADIKVTLGDTLPNDNSTATQNQPDAGTPGDVQAKDISTKNIGAEVPVNGEREASASQFIDFATQVKPLALATLTKSAKVTANTAVNTDDQIAYGLELTVENTSPSGSFSPAALTGTTINLDGATPSKILVSDAVPAGTKYDSTVTPSVPATGGWTVVYSTTPLTTAATNATWSTTMPPAATITRVGFVHDGPLAATGTAITGFNFTVVTSGVPAAGAPVYNIAQVFGQTFDDPLNPVNPTPEIVYDESGDNNPNNFNDNQTPPDSTGSNYDPATDTGVANPNVDGLDPSNTPENDGIGPDGEVTKTIIGAAPTTNEDIFNGPLNNPNATGPTDFNDDFSNVSAPVPAGTQDPFNPAAVTFKNTVQNPSTSSFAIPNVTIEPISPKQAEGADPASVPGKFGSNADIPNGTIVNIKYDQNNDGDFTDPLDQVAVYVYDATKGIYVIQPGSKPVNVGELIPGAKVDYTVTVDMPLDPAITSPLADIPVQVLAFSDDDPVGSPGFNDTINKIANVLPGSPLYKDPELNNNVTNDVVYLGYMQLAKEARVLDAAGSVKQDWNTTFSVQALPGDVIEYRIRYKNISSPMQGSGNMVLNAKNFKILEDGSAPAVGDAAANNWAASTNHQPTTKFDKGSVTYYSGSGTASPSLGAVDPAAGSAVGTYLNDVGTVAPNEAGEFMFRRQVNN